MKKFEIKVKNKETNYSIIIGDNILNILPKKIKKLCPKSLKVGLVIDKKIPKFHKIKIKKILEKRYEVEIFEYNSSEKLKSFQKVNSLAEKLLFKNFNRTDVLIAFGGGVIGDFTSFVASIVKRGINFINVPSTLLGQVDSSIGGKTGVNSKFGKNLIGSFYQPRLVLTDISLLKSLSKREMVCGYAEILKHSLIKDKKFFNWLDSHSNKILINRNKNFLKLAIFKSCKIKLHFANQDLKEKNLRMILNFGHTFAHAIEAKNKFSKKINHGEAVLIGMILATRLSCLKRICSKSVLFKLTEIYRKNNLNYNLNRFFKKKDFPKITSLMNNDKKNFNKKINLILLKKIGKTTVPGKFQISNRDLIKIFPKIT
tara:strand:+ start:71 stop:1183 length:1113 start_codon:yes stop_codon:yes gene_type:complete